MSDAGTYERTRAANQQNSRCTLLTNRRAFESGGHTFPGRPSITEGLFNGSRCGNDQALPTVTASRSVDTREGNNPYKQRLRRPLQWKVSSHEVCRVQRRDPAAGLHSVGALAVSQAAPWPRAARQLMAAWRSFGAPRKSCATRTRTKVEIRLRSDCGSGPHLSTCRSAPAVDAAPSSL